MSEVAGALTPTEHGRLLAAAVQGVAWALIEYETDTSDRGVSEEHYRDAVRRAEAILPALVPGSDAPEPRRVCSCWRLRPDGSHGKGCDLHVESSDR